MKLTSPRDAMRKIYLRRLDLELQYLIAKKGCSYNVIYLQQKRNAISILTSYNLKESIQDTKFCMRAVKYL